MRINLRSARKSILALLLAATTVLGVMGCGRGEGHGETVPPAPDAAHSGAAGSGAAQSVKDAPNKPSGSSDDSQIPLVTPENAGNPVVEVKVGDPVRVRKNGVTLTLRVIKMEALPGEPPDKNDVIAGTDCGAWGKITSEITIDTEPGASWNDWYADLGGIFAFEEGQGYGEKYQEIFVADAGQGHDSYVNVHSAAVVDRKKNKEPTFHGTYPLKSYYGMCKDSDSGEPSGREPLDAQAMIREFGNDSAIPRPLVRWFR